MADYISALTGSMMDVALTDMAQHTSEAYAIGERNGVPVTSGDPTYENNAKFWAEVSKAVSANGGEISDPNNDGHLVITTPDPSDDWAVRVDSPQTLTDAEKAQARANIAAGGSNRNLLDNWYFVGGGSQLGDGVFPINQRGQSGYTGGTGTLDRWKLLNNSGTVTLTSNGLVFSNTSAGYGYWQQKFYGSATTSDSIFSVIADGVLYTGRTNLTLPSGLYFYRSSNNSIDLRIPGNLAQSETISAIKLELGSYSTLLNDKMPNYREELEKCRFYYRRFQTGENTAAIVAAGYAASATQARFRLDGIMRSANSADVWMNGDIVIHGSTSGTHNPTAISSTWTTENERNGAVLFITTTGLTTGESCMLRLGNSSTITYSVEL